MRRMCSVLNVRLRASGSCHLLEIAQFYLTVYIIILIYYIPGTLEPQVTKVSGGVAVACWTDK